MEDFKPQTEKAKGSRRMLLQLEVFVTTYAFQPIPYFIKFIHHLGKYCVCICYGVINFNDFMVLTSTAQGIETSTIVTQMLSKQFSLEAHEYLFMADSALF